jgi:hypothetical protein
MPNLKYGTGSLYHTPQWFKLDDSYIQLMPLTNKELHALDEQIYLYNKQQIPILVTKRSVLGNAITDTINIHGFKNAKQLVKQLSNEDIDTLYDALQKTSRVSAEQLNALSSMIDIQFNQAYQDETWSCEVCRAKKLDASRGCGYLEPKDRDTSPYLPRINGVRPLICPISEFDSFILSQASTAYSFLSSGVLPEDGGIGNQTDWFVKVSLLYKRKLKEAEQQLTQNGN